MKFLKFCCLLAILMSCSISAEAVSWHPDDPDRAAGDFLQIVLPVVGLGMTWWHHDIEGSKQWAYTTLATSVSTQILKQAFNNTELGVRPNGGHQSFPSGHTSSACSGATFIGRRYGWQYGIPAMLPAAYVGNSRVDENLHHWRDVIVGCALGVAFSYYFVQPQENSFVILPNVGRDELGVSMIWSF